MVGVSTQPSSISRRTLGALQRFGYPGDLRLVHPHADEIAGMRCHTSLTSLSEPAELALVFTAAAHTLEVVRDAVESGVRSAILYASGFAEMGTAGRRAQEEIRAVAEEGNLRLLGPNCQGLMHLPNRLAATFSNSISVENLPPPGPIAYVGQSGALGGSVFDLLRERGVIPAVQVSTGNQIDVDVTDAVRYLARDDAVQLLMVYFEDIPDGARWETVCREVRASDKQIVALRAGRTEAGQRAVASHTGAVVGETRAFELMTAAYGAIEVTDVDEWIDTAIAWRAGSRNAGRRLGVVSTSGGAGGLIADHALRERLRIPPLSADTRRRLAEVLPAYASTDNPVDVTAPSGAPALPAGENSFEEACKAVAGDPDVDQLLVVLSVVVDAVGERVARGVANVAESRDLPVHVLYLASADRTADLRDTMARAGASLYASMRGAIRAIGSVTPAERFAGPPSDEQPRAAPAGRAVTEAEALAWLDTYNVPRPAGRLTKSSAEAGQAAAELSALVVLKVQSSGLMHKTELGAIRVGVAREDVAEAYGELIATVGVAAPEAEIQGVLVQAQVEAGIELLVGIQGPDAGYPPVVSVGMGGTAVEVYGDVASALAPLSRQDAHRLLQSLRCWPLLAGFRGAPPSDVSAASAAIANLTDLAVSLGDDLIELEVNPLIVHHQGLGAHATDFLARLRNR
jgi:acyl-CoA synthetase (NDP forming)